jgi:predicted DNA-binding transcriptional regulator YafY
VWCSPAIARWLAEEHPSAERFSDGSIIAEIPYASQEWLVKEITKHGGEAVLHTPEDVRPAVAGNAERILERYAATPARR